MARASLDDAAWAGVPLGSMEAHRLSPELSDDFLGLRLAAPSRVICDRAIPVAGVIALSGRDLLLPSPWAFLCIFVAASPPRIAFGKWRPRASSVDAGGPASRSIDSSFRTCIQYFTLSLQSALRTPITSGVTHVFAALGPHVSNVVRIHVEEAP